MRLSTRIELLSLAVLSLAFAATAQQQQYINARISGGGGAGKCTFEIKTGGTADVEIRGNQGRVRSVNGAPAQWVRLDCNQPLPRNPNSFRFKGVDGRGSQNLLRNPNSNNGIATIRIVDNRGGMQGYTGDIMWNGGNSNGGNWNDGSWGGSGGGWGNGGGNGSGWNNGGNNQWPGGSNNWSNRIVPNCQQNIRNQLVPRYGGSLNFMGNPTQDQRGSFVMVDGKANYRDSRGQTGQITYHCTMHPNGNVADANYNVISGNFQPQPR